MLYIFIDLDGVCRDFVGAVNRLYQELFHAESVISPYYDLALRYPLWDADEMQDMVFREQAERIERLSEQYAPFASRLRELSRSFEERQILALIEQFTGAEERDERGGNG